MSCMLDTNVITAHLKNNEKIKAKIEEAKFRGEKLFQDLRKDSICRVRNAQR